MWTVSPLLPQSTVSRSWPFVVILVFLLQCSLGEQGQQVRGEVVALLSLTSGEGCDDSLASCEDLRLG